MNFVKNFYPFYTFSISGLPKNPVGKNIKTTTNVVKAAISLYSIEIYPDQNVSISPIKSPPKKEGRGVKL